MLYIATTFLFAVVAARAAYAALYPERVESVEEDTELTTRTTLEVRKWHNTFRWELYDLKEEVAREITTYRHRDASTVLGDMPPRIMNAAAPFAAFGPMHPMMRD